MDNRPLGPRDGLEAAPDQMLAGLHEHLHGDVIRDAVLVYQAPQEQKLGLRRRGKAHLDLLEADPHQQVEILELLFH